MTKCHPLAGPYAINVASGADSIILSWRSVSSYSLLLQEFHVTVTSECPSGVLGIQTQIYNISSEDNSLTIGNLGTPIAISAVNYVRRRVMDNGSE